MRENQVTIRIERFGDGVPEEFQEYKLQVMEVYADGNDLYGTLYGAFQLALDEVAKYHYDNFVKRRESYDSLELTQRKVKILGIDRKK
ncbi:hypothetical protein GYN12_06980 [Lactococcus piscium]|uniref:hypothetical protein n=1 Tax=Pseudolactococcus carnosus TaxID=2749961 RepID=UPI0015DC1559|nr:hypothetical protein [Lactococcus carnosus]MCJ1972439.1 hypothetical protein [Lactococcus carnosus]MCJ1975715.1 hypothetical protein [Lactococcus carnosus]MCJ1985960.1 hypothetical protein [Lactococcus carnosus]MCJ1987106.1 hypothetical protein [Lactococcus carnosus]MCJ2004191.1 hypothetical protein [Lactococcus carnosus]